MAIQCLQALIPCIHVFQTKKCVWTQRADSTKAKHSSRTLTHWIHQSLIITSRKASPNFVAFPLSFPLSPTPPFPLHAIKIRHPQPTFLIDHFPTPFSLVCILPPTSHHHLKLSPTPPNHSVPNPTPPLPTTLTKTPKTNQLSSTHSILINSTHTQKERLIPILKQLHDAHAENINTQLSNPN